MSYEPAQLLWFSQQTPQTTSTSPSNANIVNSLSNTPSSPHPFYSFPNVSNAENQEFSPLLRMSLQNFYLQLNNSAPPTASSLTQTQKTSPMVAESEISGYSKPPATASQIMPQLQVLECGTIDKGFAGDVSIAEPQYEPLTLQMEPMIPQLSELRPENAFVENVDLTFEFATILIEEIYKLIKLNALEDGEPSTKLSAFQISKNVFRRLSQDLKGDSELLCQFVSTLQEMVCEQVIAIDCEEELQFVNEYTKTKYFTISSMINVHLLKLIIRTIYFITRLGSFDEIYLNKSNDKIIDVDKERLEGMSFQQLEEDLAVFESKIRFTVNLVEFSAEDQESEIPVELLNNDKHLTFKKNDNELYIKFDEVGVPYEEIEHLEKVKFRIYANFDELISVCQDGYRSFTKGMFSDGRPEVIVKQIVPNYGRKRGRTPVQVNLERLHSPTITPNRKLESVLFEAEFNNGKQAAVEAVLPGCLKIRTPSLAKIENLKLRVKYCNRIIGEEDFQCLDETEIARKDLEESSSDKKRQSPTALGGNPRKKQKKTNKVFSPEYEQKKKQEEEENRWIHYILNSKELCGFTMLHVAAFRGYTKLCQFLLTKGVNVNLADNYGYTAFHWSCYSGNKSVTLLLLDKGASVSMRDFNLKTGLDIAKERGQMGLCTDISSFLERSAIFALKDLCSSENHNSELLKAARTGDIELLDRLLETGAEISTTDEFGNTALHIAVKHSQPICVERLLQFDSIVNMANHDGALPLHLAAAIADIKVAEILLRNGKTDINTCSVHNLSPLHMAVYRASCKMVKFLLEKGADIHAKHESNRSRTPLHVAIENSETDLIRLLLEHKANIFELDADGKTPLDLANPKIRQFTEKLYQQVMQKSKKRTNDTLSPPSSPTSATSSRSILEMEDVGATSQMTMMSSMNSTAKQAVTSTGGDSPQPSIHPGMTMELLIKPSRKKRRYISFFPKELCSSPYKYDILLRIPLHYNNVFNENQFQFRLLIQGTDLSWTNVDNGIKVVKYLRTMFPLNFREIEWRIMFKVCSFHYHRKPFKFQVIHISDGNAPKPDGKPESLQDQTIRASSSESSSSPTTPATPSSRTPQPLDPSLQQPQPTAGDKTQPQPQPQYTLPNYTIVFESQLFWIVARKKKENDFWGNTLTDDEEMEEPSVKPAKKKRKTLSKKKLPKLTLDTSALPSPTSAFPPASPFSATSAHSVSSFPSTPTSPSVLLNNTPTNIRKPENLQLHPQ